MTARHLLRIGIGVFSCFIILAFLFFKERAVFLDVSFHLFSILKDNSFAIQNNRFAAFFTQLFPLFGSRAGLSLTAVSVLYTLSFVVLHALMFFLVLVKLKNTKVALAYLIYLVIMTTHTFFWVQSEMPQGAAFLFLFVALMENVLSGRNALKNSFLFAAPLLMLAFAFAHPLLLFPFCFIMLFMMLQYRSQWRVIFALLAAGITMFLVKSVFMLSSYDQTAMAGMGNLAAYFPDYFSHPSNRKFVQYIIHDYYFLIIAFAASLFYYFATRQFLRMGLLFCFFAGYALLINISYPQGGDQFYMENLYLNLGMMVAFPLAFDVLPALSQTKWQLAAVVVLCVFCMVRIWLTHPQYSARLNWQRSILTEAERSPNKKWILSSSSWPKDTLLMSWGSSYEFWLLSTMERKYSASVIIEETPGEFDQFMHEKHRLITKWGVFDHSKLNLKYFIFPDTGSYAKVVRP